MNCRPPLIRRSFSDNILMGIDLNAEELAQEVPPPSRENVNGGISETNSQFPFYENGAASSRYESSESLSLKLVARSDCYSFLIHSYSLITSYAFSSVMRIEDLSIGTRPSQMLPGSSSNSDSQRPHDDIPGFGHSYKTQFTPAEEIFERYT